MLSLKLLILISLFQYGQSVTLTLSELEDWKNQMRAELKLEIKTEIYQELPETEDIKRIYTELGKNSKNSHELISAVQDHTIQLESLQEFSQELLLRRDPVLADSRLSRSSRSSFMMTTRSLYSSRKAR